MQEVCLKGLLWVFFEKIGLTLLSVVATFWYAIILGPEGFGFAAILLSIPLLISGIQDSIQQFPLIASNKDVSTVFSASLKGWLIISVALSVLLFLFLIYFYGFEYWVLILLAVLHIPISSLSRVFVADLIKKQAFKELALRAFLGKLLGVFSGLLSAYLGFVKLAIILQSLVTIVVAFVVMLRSSQLLPELKFRIFQPIDWTIFKSLVVEGVPSGFNVLEQGVKSHGLVVLLGFFIGPSAAGLYSLAIKLVDLPRVLVGFGFSSWAMGKFHAVKENNHKLLYVFESAFICSLLILFPCYVGMITLSDILIKELFGAEWGNASIILAWLSSYYFIVSLFLFLPPLQVLYKTTYKTLPINVFSTVVILFSLIFFPDHFGLYSPLIGMFFTLLFIVPKFSIEMSLALKSSTYVVMKSVPVLMLLSFLMSLSVQAFRYLLDVDNVPILIVFGVLSYLLSVYLAVKFKAIDSSLILRIRQL